MDIWVRPLMAVNVFLYRLTGGRLGGRMAGQSVLLLHTRGRKTGKEYIVPVNYFPDGDRYVLVGSNWGKPSHPGWFFNLMAQPEASVQIKDRTLQVSARQAEGEEYNRLWAYVTGKNPFYVRYQQQTERRIPLVILAPIS